MSFQSAPIEAFVDPFDVPQPSVRLPVAVKAPGPSTKPRKVAQSKAGKKKKWYKKTPVRDTDKPKRPLSGYNLFFRDARKTLLEALPERHGDKPRRTHGKINFQELGKRISRMWNTLDPETKNHYQAMGQVNRGVYYQALKEYKAKQLPTSANLPEKKPKVACTRTGILPTRMVAELDPIMPLEFSPSACTMCDLPSRGGPDERWSSYTETKSYTETQMLYHAPMGMIPHTTAVTTRWDPMPLEWKQSPDNTNEKASFTSQVDPDAMHPFLQEFR